MTEGTLPNETEKWALLVGRFISSFNEIELSVIKLWEIYFGRTEKPRRFSHRIDCLLKAIDTSSEAKSLSKSAAGELKRAKKLAKKRNIIAHNPVQVQVWKRRASEKYHLYFSISTEADEEIREDEMPGLTEIANEISLVLFDFIGALEREKSPI